MLESVIDLKNQLRNLGSNLVIIYDKPEKFFPHLLFQNKDNDNLIIKHSLVIQEEVCSEELNVENLVIEELQKYQVNSFITRWGSTLYHYEDMDISPEESASIYGNFMRQSTGTIVRKIERTPEVGELPFPNYDTLSKQCIESIEKIPSLSDFGFQDIQMDERACLEFKGGETEGLKRLNQYIFKFNGLMNYKTTRNGFLGPNFSSKFSPWMANGCLSPRQIYWEVKKWEKENGENEHSQHFIAELFWRDFWHYWAYKYQNKIFFEYGYANRSQIKKWETNQEIVQRWKNGETGMPIIDAIMRDLKTTGFISNRARQMTASYFCLDLKQDWRYGAYYFEETLIDHDVHSNTGGWNAAGGMGPGKVLNFNQIKQSQEHDKLGLYIKQWCPELKNLPQNYIHEPWLMSKEEQQKFNFVIGKDYPYPIPCSKYIKGKANFSQNDLGFKNNVEEIKQNFQEGKYYQKKNKNDQYQQKQKE